VEKEKKETQCSGHLTYVPIHFLTNFSDEMKNDLKKIPITINS
jgi:hypothetical protein